MSSVKVPVKVDRLVTVPAKPAATFEVIADLPQLLADFQKTHEVALLDDDVFVWTLKKIGPPRYQQHIAYTCQWGTEGGHKVWWRPAEEAAGDLAGPPDFMTGLCDLSPAPGGTAAHLSISADIVLELPRMARMLAPPVVKVEFERTIDLLVRHIKAELA